MKYTVLQREVGRATTPADVEAMMCKHASFESGIYDIPKAGGEQPFEVL